MGSVERLMTSECFDERHGMTGAWGQLRDTQGFYIKVNLKHPHVSHGLSICVDSQMRLSCLLTSFLNSSIYEFIFLPGSDA